jgi:hypothetical protein
MKLSNILYTLSFFAFSQILFGHPVNFKGSVGVMSYNSAAMNELSLSYSFTSRLALAGFFLREDDSEFYLVRGNILAKRWNNEKSQGNIYLGLGTGTENYHDRSFSAHMGEIVADWESRKYYILAKHLALKRDVGRADNRPQDDSHHSSLRLGFAPFLADYKDLNIWLIAQFDQHNLRFDQFEEGLPIEVTPYLRFYSRNVLWELGSSLNGSMKFNFMVHI